MFDIGAPLLVFETHTLSPVSNEFSGFIFNLYEWDARKPRPLFFSTIAEAQMFAARYGAKLTLDVDETPREVTAVEYVSNHDPFVETRGRAPGSYGGLAETSWSSEEHWHDEPGLDALAPDDPVSGTAGDIDFFGEDE